MGHCVKPEGYVSSLGMFGDHRERFIISMCGE